ncbi:hypothetical protein LEP1GSC064_3337 [Leptospira kirschneri serovar Grippotyphosa str. Moskva]|nr:hypothetical protein LEP1GSC064_3337 [Leptospira kirschneri serovar Grippotyphosa str. Moskva]
MLQAADLPYFLTLDLLRFRLLEWIKISTQYGSRFLKRVICQELNTH